MNRKIRTMVLALALVLLLPLLILVTELGMPVFYGESYYAQLPELYHRLSKTQGPKLIVIGGSNVAFGLDTALLEEILAAQGYDYTVCPFGLYAAVGTSVMLELAEDILGRGDVVVLAVEPTSETMSTYFGATAFWKCCETHPELLLPLSETKRRSMAGNYIPYLQERYSLLTDRTMPRFDGVYTKASFDETGNMIFHRAGNDMALGYDASTPVDLGSVVIAPEFAQQVNAFCELAWERGAQVYFSFSPVNRSAITDETDVQHYFDLCNDTFACPVISDPRDYVLDSGWFYDNNFHLNSPGALLRTYQLAEDLLAQWGCYEAIDPELPHMPGSIAQLENAEADGDCFLYEAFGEGWQISGLTETGLSRENLTVPSLYQGKPVIGFTPGAFSGHPQMRELTLPESIESLPDGIFAGCIHLERLVLRHRERLCAVTENTFAGADQVRIFVPSESYALYRDGDGCEVNLWRAYLQRIYAYG